jgi:hypothetical protein
MTTLIWARRGLGFFVGALLVGFVVSTALSGHPWLLEFDWAVRYSAAYVYVLAPLVAGAVAYDVGRRASAGRGVMATISPVAAVLGWVVSGVVAGWGMFLVITQTAGGLAPGDPWVFVESIASLTAAGCVGMVLAVMVDGVLAVAVSAGAVLTAATLSSGHGANLFQVATSSGTMVGLERTPERAAATIACHLVVIAVACTCVTAVQRAHVISPRWGVVAAVAVAVPVAAVTAWPYPDSEYRPSTERQTCVRSVVQVCGPQSARSLLAVAAGDLNAATEKLRGSRLPLPQHYVVVRGAAVATLGAEKTLLELDSSQLVDGHLSPSAVASAVSTPRMCRGFFSDREAQALLEHVRVVSAWVRGALARTGPASIAPDPVSRAYAALTQCPVK